MARSQSDISNSTIRIFLQKVSAFYDQQRNFDKFVPNKKQKEELLEYFDYKCCYCGKDITLKDFSQDHLVPMNRKDLGLHAWGNVVPCCKDCNNEKQQKGWLDFLSVKSKGPMRNERKLKIIRFRKDKQYKPNLNLTKIASNLYEDVGAVSTTLINLRFDQAKEEITKILSK